MPPLVEVLVAPPSDKQWISQGSGNQFRPAIHSNRYDAQPLPIKPVENVSSQARIVSRNVDELGVRYHVKIGEVPLDNVSVEEILEFVSALELEEFENREFEKEREVFKVLEAERAREEEERREQRKERAKSKGTVVFLSDADDQSEDEEGSHGVRSRKRPDYSQFYLKGTQRVKQVAESEEDERKSTLRPAGPHLPPLDSFTEPIKRRRRKRDPVTGELMPLSPIARNQRSPQSTSSIQNLSNLSHRNQPRRKRHPLTGEMMPLGYRFDPSNPDTLKWVGFKAPSLKKLSIDDEPEAKRVRVGMDGSFSAAVSPPVLKAEATSSVSPRPQSSRDSNKGFASSSKAPVINILDSDEDEDMDEEPAIKDFLQSTTRSPINAQLNLLEQSVPSPRSNVMLSSPSKQSARAMSPGKTSMLNPSAAQAVSTEASARPSAEDEDEGEESDEEWFVEDIIGHTWSNPETHPPEFGRESIMLYQVKWLGFENTTWEPAESFDDMSTLEDYRKSVGLKKLTPPPSIPSAPVGDAIGVAAAGSSVRPASSGNVGAIVIDDGSPEDVEYEVERIVAHHMSDPRTHPGKPAVMLYKVKWKGYIEPTFTWEPGRSFGDKTILRRYQERCNLPMEEG